MTTTDRDLGRPRSKFAERDARIAELEHELGRARLRIKMAADAMAFDPRDWSLGRTDAWLWALLIGWGDALHEIIQRHGSAFHGANALAEEPHHDDD